MVVEIGGSADLPQKALAPGLQRLRLSCPPGRKRKGGLFAAHQLDRYASIQPLVVGLPDVAHTTGTDRFLEPIATSEHSRRFHAILRRPHIAHRLLSQYEC